MEKHINIVASLQIGFSIFGILIGIVGFLILHVVGSFSGDNEAEMILSIIANVIIIFFALMSIPGIIAGIGLFKRKEWARILTLIISVLNLFNFPFGTAVGVYSIWVLSNEENANAFKN
ncbi:MAG: transmembrane 9 family protein [Chlorobi bacterium]|nr:transmembrane 9 family protein [Chlorobiota bacterium]